MNPFLQIKRIESPCFKMCPVCMEKFKNPKDIIRMSLVSADPAHSPFVYFFYAHLSCWSKLPITEQEILMSIISIDHINPKKNGNNKRPYTKKSSKEKQVAKTCKKNDIKKQLAFLRRKMIERTLKKLLTIREKISIFKM